MLAKQLLRLDGKGFTARDPPRAQKLLEKGCSHNHGPSCYNLTVMYKNGDDGVPRCVLVLWWSVYEGVRTADACIMPLRGTL